MAPQDAEHERIDRDVAGSVALRCSDHAALVRALDAEGARVAIHVAPLQREGFADPHTSAEQNLSHRPVPGRSGNEVRPRLRRRERPDRRRVVGQLQRGVAVVAHGRVARDHSLAYGSREDLPQRAEGLVRRLAADRARRVEVGEIRLDTGARDLPQLEVAERRHQSALEVLPIDDEARRLDARSLRRQPSVGVR